MSVRVRFICDNCGAIQETRSFERPNKWHGPEKLITSQFGIQYWIRDRSDYCPKCKEPAIREPNRNDSTYSMEER